MPQYVCCNNHCQDIFQFSTQTPVLRLGYLPAMQSGLLHFARRFRRHLGMAFSVHLLVLAALTGLPACHPLGDSMGDALGDPQPAVSSVEQGPHHAHAGHRGALAEQTVTGTTQQTADSPASHEGHESHATDPLHHHGAAPLTCPMSMACAVNAIVTTVPAPESGTLLVSSAPTLENDALPRSSRIAPEPPPPRG